jgi:hypothetical protein
MSQETASLIAAWSAAISAFATIIMAWFAWTSVKVSRESVALARRSQELAEKVTADSKSQQQRSDDLLQALVVATVMDAAPVAYSLTIEKFNQLYKGKTKIFP